MYIYSNAYKQHSEISFCSLTHFHLIADLVHLLASVHAERTCVYAYKVVWGDVRGIGVSLSADSQDIVRELKFKINEDTLI